MRVLPLVIVLVVALATSPCDGDNVWDALLPALTNQLTSSLWDQGEMELLGHYCSYAVRPKIRSWELYYVGNLWCPGWTPIRGDGLTRSRSGILINTTKDFIRKTLAAGIITQEEARPWLI